MMSDIITVTGEVTYKAWIAPKNAFIMIGEIEAKIPVENLSDDALDGLAQAWLDHLYSSVKRRPPTIPIGNQDGE